MTAILKKEQSLGRETLAVMKNIGECLRTTNLARAAGGGRASHLRDEVMRNISQTADHLGTSTTEVTWMVNNYQFNTRSVLAKVKERLAVKYQPLEAVGEGA